MKSARTLHPEAAPAVPASPGTLHRGFAVWMWRCAVVLPHPGLESSIVPPEDARAQTAQSRLAPSRSVASSFEKLRRMMPRSVPSE